MPDTPDPSPDHSAQSNVQLFTISSIHREIRAEPSAGTDHSLASATDVMEPMPPAITEILDQAGAQGGTDPAPGPAMRSAILIDAAQDSQSEISVILDQFDISTIVVRDGKAAIRAMISTTEVASVLIDLQTMSHDALETARRISEIKTDLCAESCMVIGLVESGRGTNERDLRAAGFTHLLKKPVKKSVLRRLFGTDSASKPALPKAKTA